MRSCVRLIRSALPGLRWILAAGLAFAVPFARADNGRRVHSLDDDWRFHLGAWPRAEADGPAPATLVLRIGP